MTPCGIVIETERSHDTGVCACCGGTTRRVWGYAYAHERCLAAYFVEWTLGSVLEHGAHVDLIIGDWGDATTAADRALVCLEYRVLETGGAFMVIDAAPRRAAKSTLVGHVLRRD